MSQSFITPHKKIGYLFVTLTSIILILTIAALIQMSYRAKIVIYSNLEPIEINFIENMECQILEKAATIEETFSPSALVTMEDFATGEVVIINNSYNNQTLVATTRLLTPEGLIFRLTEKVTIPARQKIKTTVRADKVGELYEIGPTKFTIPGLSSILQKQVYAESEKPMTGGIKKVGIVTQKDIDEATNQLKDKLSATIVEDLKKELANKNLKMAIRSEIIDFFSSAKANDEVDKFTIKLELKVTAALLNEEQLIKLAQEKLATSVAKGRKLEKIDPMTFAYRLKEYDVSNQKATLEIHLAGNSILNENNIAFSKENFLGRSQKEIINYLIGIEGVEGVKVKFSPFFIKTAPQSPNRIDIIIKTK